MAEKLAERVSSSTNPKNLDDSGADGGEDEEEDTLGAGSTREFFWDKLVLFLSTAIVALTAVDILTELLRGGDGVMCFVPEDLNASDSQEDFIQSFCSQSIPDTQYLPIFVLIHGVLIGAAHFVWKSSFGSHFNYFFSLASNLARLREENTGDYPFQNFSIIKKLQVEFSSYSRRKVFTWYRIKLLIQLLITVASLLVSFFLFNDFDVDFRCPRDDPSDIMIWPYPDTRVDCIFTSLRLFWLVWIVDLVLLFLVGIFVIWGLLWSIFRHPKELNIRDAALFTFSTGIDPTYFVPKSPFQNILQFCRVCCSRLCIVEVKQRFFENRMVTDFDFFVMLLYRVDSGLAHAFHEGQVLIEVGALRELDYQLLDYQFNPVNKALRRAAVRRDDSAEEDETAGKVAKMMLYRDKKVKYRYDHIDTGWAEHEGGRDGFSSLDNQTALAVPDNIRGVVMGLGFRAPANKLAISISFGSYGFSDVLVRVFKKVGALNFDPAYRDEEELVHYLPTTYGVTKFRSGDDVFRLNKTFKRFLDCANKLIYEDKEDIQNLVSYVVVGPIAEVKHVGTAKHFLRRLKNVYEKGAIVVIIEPVEIEGTNGKKQFYYFTPEEKLFEWYDPNLGIDNWTPALKWPSSDRPYQSNLRSTSRHQNYKAATKEESLKKSVSLKCGRSWCRFRIQCYKLRETKKGGGGGGRGGRGGGRARRQPPPLPKNSNESRDSLLSHGQRGGGGGGGGEGGAGREAGSFDHLQPAITLRAKATEKGTLMSRLP